MIRKTQVEGGKNRVSETRDEVIGYCISVKWAKRVHHCMFSSVLSGAKSEAMDAEVKSVQEFIDRCVEKRRSLNKDGVKLVRPIEVQQWEFRHEQLQLGKDILGKGEFGLVYKGTLTLKNNEKVAVAVKELNGLQSKKDRENFFREARHMRRFKHPNIIKIIGVAALHSPFFLILELAQNGSLLNLLKKEGKKLPDKQKGITVKLHTWHFFSQLDRHDDPKVKFVLEAARGMEYLERKKFIHRDLAARNCLMGKDKELKISDFGLSKQMKVYKVQTQERLPLKWMSPETHRTGHFTLKSDVWSYGIVIWEIYSNGAEPYPGLRGTEVQKLVGKQGYTMDPPKKCTNKTIIEVMRSCQKPAEQRPTFAEIRKTLEEHCRATDRKSKK